MRTPTSLRTLFLTTAIAALAIAGGSACGDDCECPDAGGGGQATDPGGGGQATDPGGGGGGQATDPGGGGGGQATDPGGGGGEAGFLTVFCTDACTKAQQCTLDQFNADYGSIPECVSACEEENAELADESLQCQGAITAQAACYNGLSCDAFNAAGEDGAEACASVDAAIEAACMDPLGSGLPGFSDSGLPGFSDSDIPGFSDSGLPGFSDSDIPGFSEPPSTVEPSGRGLLEGTVQTYCFQLCANLAICAGEIPGDDPDCYAECEMFMLNEDVFEDGMALTCAGLLDDVAQCEEGISCEELQAIYGQGGQNGPIVPTCGDEYLAYEPCAAGF